MKNNIFSSSKRQCNGEELRNSSGALPDSRGALRRLRKACMFELQPTMVGKSGGEISSNGYEMSFNRQ
jgi:hypothetical protein